MATMPTPRERELTDVLADMVDLAWFRVDAERNVVELSPAMERLTGFAASEVLGRSCLRLHRCRECLSGCGVFDEGVVTDKSLEIYRADGSLIEVTKSGRLLFGPDGEISGAVEVLRSAPAQHDATEEDEPEEARAIRTALEKTRYNRTAAARSLGISRTSLWRKMKEYGI
jgi:PAS domain S-box-containing protein